MENNISQRMKKNYEDRQRFYLTRRTPVIMRLDGRAFHTLTKAFERPFSETFHSLMVETTRALLQEVQGAKVAYTQSDEISLLIIDFDTLETEAWFDYNVQKMVSVGASIASTTFYKAWLEMEASHREDCGDFHLEFRSIFERAKPVQFDCRVFNLPKEEVNNYFIWRQQDWFRNSLNMYAQSFFSHKELHGKGRADIHEMLHKINKNWAFDLTDWQKNGTTILKGKEPEKVCPIFTEEKVM